MTPIPTFELILEPNATVALSSHINLVDFDSEKIIDSEPESDSGTASETTKPHCLNLVIANGNVIHPYSTIHIIPPKSLSCDLTFRVGDNNLFEEQCRVTIDLSNFEVQDTNADGTDEGAAPKEKKLTVHSIMGSYNQFGPRSKVRASSIGNSNIFKPLCDLTLGRIKHGNVFQVGAQIDVNAPKISLAKDDTDFDEKVVFVLNQSNGIDDMSGRHQLVRSHLHGVKKNMADVSLLLLAARKIIEKHHRILPPGGSSSLR
jgi:hypothetical protein